MSSVKCPLDRAVAPLDHGSLCFLKTTLFFRFRQQTANKSHTLRLSFKTRRHHETVRLQVKCPPRERETTPPFTLKIKNNKQQLNIAVVYPTRRRAGELLIPVAALTDGKAPSSSSRPLCLSPTSRPAGLLSGSTFTNTAVFSAKRQRSGPPFIKRAAADESRQQALRCVVFPRNCAHFFRDRF